MNQCKARNLKFGIRNKFQVQSSKFQTDSFAPFDLSVLRAFISNFDFRDSDFLLPLVANIAVVFLMSIPGNVSAESVMYVSPERGSYTVGQTFEMKVYADTGGALVNAAEGELSFNTDALEVQNISTDGSVLESWSSQPEFSNTEGTIHFAGWTKNNYSGVSGLLITVTFKALKSAVGNARLAAGAILAADGQETNIITSMRSGVFTIAAEEAKPSPATMDGTDASSTNAIAAKVPPPSFDDYPDTVSVGDRIVIRGNAEPNAHVYVWLSRGTEHEDRYDVLSASDGSFTFVSNDKAVPGVYHLRAAVETEDGRQSPQTESIDITAADSGVAASAVFGASLLFEVLPFLALVVFGGLGAAYIYHRHQLAKMHYGRHSMFDAQE